MFVKKNFKENTRKKMHRLYSCKQFKNLTRNIVFAEQVKENGFSDREIWSLDISFAQWLLPKVSEVYPIISKDDVEINEIVWFLRLTAEEDAIFPIAEEHRERAYEASELLGKRFFKLLPDKDAAKKLGIDAAKWLYPRFHRLNEMKLTKTLMEPETVEVFREINWFLWRVSKKHHINFNQEQKKRLKHAKKLFGKYFLGLWW